MTGTRIVPQNDDNVHVILALIPDTHDMRDVPTTTGDELYISQCVRNTRTLTQATWVNALELWVDIPRQE